MAAVSDEQPTDTEDVLARKEQSELLKQRLAAPGAVVNLHGAPGSGKTALAHRFVDENSRHFAGGVLVVAGHGNLSDHRPRFSALDLAEPSLVVIDDLQFADVESISRELAWLREERPQAGVLTISDIHISPTPSTQAIEMPPLPLGSVLSLLERRGGRQDPARLERLAAGLAGNVSVVTEVSRRLASGMPAERIIDWLEQRRLVVARGPEGAELPLGSLARQAIDVAVTEISDALIKDLATHPERLYELTPRRFEELVAELYRRRGFEATLTPASGDEGVDVYVVRKDDLGQTLWVVQAKRYAAHNKIGAGVVRELYGTVTAKNASAGVVVTTSFFEPGAERLQREYQYRLGLRDYLSLREMLTW